MKLSDGEKLILVMLSELCQKLKAWDEKDAKLVQDAIHSGNLWALEWEFSGIFGPSEPSDDALREATDIMTMWAVLERDYESLAPAEKARVEKEAEPFGADVKFDGFDGNGESEYLSIAN